MVHLCMLLVVNYNSKYIILYFNTISNLNLFLIQYKIWTKPNCSGIKLKKSLIFIGFQFFYLFIHGDLQLHFCLVNPIHLAKILLTWFSSLSFSKIHLVVQNNFKSARLLFILSSLLLSLKKKILFLYQ